MTLTARPPAVRYPDAGDLPAVVRRQVCNGIGPARGQGLGSRAAWALALLPLCWLRRRGVLVRYRRAGDVHDLLYALGGTWRDKRLADGVFLAELLTITAERSSLVGRLHGWLVSAAFFLAVAAGGWWSFRQRARGPLSVEALEAELRMREGGRP